jgi:MFS family permease
MASINTVCSLGCLLGPVVGGVLYEIPCDPASAFRLPFLVCAAIPLLLLPFVHCFMPQEYISGEEVPAPTGDTTDAESAPPKAANELETRLPLTLSVFLGLLSIALSGTIVGTLDPTLGWRLSAAPFRFQPSIVSLFFFFSSLVYVCVSTPTGWLIDRLPPSSRLYKLITCMGFLILFLTFALLAPIGPAAFGIPHGAASHDPIQPLLNSLPVVSIAIGLKGVGSALSNNAIYPDLVLNLPENPVLQATVTAWWNAAYAIGWAAGPFVGGWLDDAFLRNDLCIGDDALPPNCPAHQNMTAGSAVLGGTRPVRAMLGLQACSLGVSAGQSTAVLSQALDTIAVAPPPPSPNATGCLCDWAPANGFDGFASSTALLSLVYAIILSIAVCTNVQNPPRSAVEADAPSVEPLVVPHLRSD